MFDFSDYSLNSKFFYPVNKKAIGKMKDEFKGKIISEFIGSKSKMYSTIAVDSEKVKKAKGVNENVVKKISIDRNQIDRNQIKSIKGCVYIIFQIDKIK